MASLGNFGLTNNRKLKYTIIIGRDAAPNLGVTGRIDGQFG